MCTGDGARARCACALCGAAADLHCEADAAFLCAPCDAQVHGANFLASRHRRTRVSPPQGLHVLCLSSSTATTSISSCMSRATTAALQRRGARGEAVLESWAKRMGLEAGAARRHAVAAGRAIRVQVAAATPRVPLRVVMAAALWWEVAAHGGVHDPGGALQRLEACAHVPARLLMAAAAASVIGGARVKKRTTAVDAWGECSIVSLDKTPSSPRHELCLFV